MLTTVVRRARCLLPVLALLVFSNTSSADTDFWPGAGLSDDVPTLKSVVGHESGEQISAPEQLVRYLEALADHAPERTRLVEYGRTWEGRPLVYLVLGSQQNMARVDAIRSGMQQLADPRSTSADVAAELIDGLPAVVWLSYGVHGNEISSGDAALVLAHHLLAASDDTFTSIMDEVLVIIDPAQNPDGRARFVTHYRQHAGIEPAVSSIAAERREAWPGGRTNHYLFDMNRDWFALTQPETRGRVEHMLQYFPLVHADIHEMGTDSTYYFPPPARPFNPHITDPQKAGLDALGKGMADVFDQFGFDYFTREVFDALYPGYGDSWPTFHGSLGMTFEMASARGLAGQRKDGSIVTYRDGVHRQFLATMGTLQVSARDRKQLLESFYDFRATALKDARVYGIPLNGNDASVVHALADRLTFQGVEVSVAQQSTKLCGDEMAAGSLVIRAGQPAGRLVRTLLDTESPMRADFLAEQERRRAKDLGVELYDVLGWSLPATANLAMTSCDGRVREGDLASWDNAPDVALPVEAGLAYLVPWGQDAAARFLAGAVRAGLAVHTSTRPFTQNGRDYGAGTLILKNKDNGDDLHAVILRLAAANGAEVIATDTSWTDKGSNFGSSHVRRIPHLNVALAWDEPTTSLSAGATRYLLERHFGYPVTPVRTAHLKGGALDDFQVVILPNGGGYAKHLGKSGISDLKAWIGDGGILVGFGRATRFLSENELLTTQREYRAGLEAPKEKKEKPKRPAGTELENEEAYQTAILPEKAEPYRLPGVVLQGVVDADHWLSAGVAPTLNFVVTGSDIYQPLKRDAGTNVVRFADTEALTAGGHLWAESRTQLAYKPVVMTEEHGDGHVIGFVADPTFRAFMDGLTVLFSNAVFRAPAYAGY